MGILCKPIILWANNYTFVNIAHTRLSFFCSARRENLYNVLHMKLKSLFPRKIIVLNIYILNYNLNCSVRSTFSERALVKGRIHVGYSLVFNGLVLINIHKVSYMLHNYAHTV